MIDDCRLKIADWEVPLRESVPSGKESSAVMPGPIGNRQSSVVDPYEGWQLCAEYYDKLPNPLLCLEERSLLSLLPDLKGLVVADLGCGTGRWLARFKEERTKLSIGLDFSPAMLEQASRKPGLRGCMIQANLQQIPIQSGTMDFLFCSFTLGYLRQLDSFVEELHRIMKPNGRLFLTDLHPATWPLGWKRSFKAAGQTIEIENVSHSISAICACFERCFRQVEQRAFTFGEPEFALFEQTGKQELFKEWHQIPAILFSEWCKTIPPPHWP